MLEILHHSLIDTVKLFPWLLLIYIIIELLERKTNLAGSKSRFGGSLGPLVGSATGLVPQCGFSVMAAKLFEQKYITVGTLFAIFMSTSDEAFVILLSSGTGALYLLPMLATKMLVGIAVGYATDGALRLFSGKKQALKTVVTPKEPKTTKDIFFAREESERFECTSCGRSHDEGKPFQTYFLSPLVHSLTVLVFIFLVNFALGYIIHEVTEERFMAFMNKGLFVQPFIASLIGLIPNCASSVVITECFLQNSLSFGSCVAGLCANAGLGFVVLLKNTRRWKRNLALIGVCYAISVLVGLLCNFLWAVIV